MHPRHLLLAPPANDKVVTGSYVVGTGSAGTGCSAGCLSHAAVLYKPPRWKSGQSTPSKNSIESYAAELPINCAASNVRGLVTSVTWFGKSGAGFRNDGKRDNIRSLNMSL